MSRLVYFTTCSLDGYSADEAGNFDFAAPSAETHAFVNDLVADSRLHLYGRRNYEVMEVWETLDPEAFQDSESLRDAMDGFAAIWRETDKVVYSSTLTGVTTARTRLERSFDPAAVRALVDAAPTDVLIGGPTLAGAAIRAGIVDGIHLLVVPTVLGGGLQSLPDGVRTDLELVDHRRFKNGAVHLGYRVAR